MPNFIFSRQHIDRQKNFARLRANKSARWLLRVSKFDGMLTVDTLADNGSGISYRFGFVPKQGWTIIDGKDAVRFLVRIKENLEDPSRLLLGI